MGPEGADRTGCRRRAPGASVASWSRARASSGGSSPRGSTQRSVCRSGYGPPQYAAATPRPTGRWAPRPAFARSSEAGHVGVDGLVPRRTLEPEVEPVTDLLTTRGGVQGPALSCSRGPGPARRPGGIGVPRWAPPALWSEGRPRRPGSRSPGRPRDLQAERRPARPGEPSPARPSGAPSPAWPGSVGMTRPPMGRGRGPVAAGTISRSATQSPSPGQPLGRADVMSASAALGGGAAMAGLVPTAGAARAGLAGRRRRGPRRRGRPGRGRGARSLGHGGAA